MSDEYGVETTEEFYDGDDENRRCCGGCCTISRLVTFFVVLLGVLLQQEASQSSRSERLLAFKTMKPSSLSVLSSVSEYIEAMKVHPYGTDLQHRVQFL